MQTFAVLLVVFFLVILLLVLLRTRVGDRFEIRNTDILMALVPVVFWLLLSGEVKVLEFAGFKMELAFEQASSRTVENQVETLPLEQIVVGAKAGYGRIPRLIESRTVALQFELDRGGYYDGRVIREYLEELTPHSFFRYMVVRHPDGTFFGMADARAIHAYLIDSRDARRPASEPSPSYPAGDRPPQGPPPQQTLDTGERPERASYDDFATWLNDNDTRPLLRLPTLLPVSAAITPTTPRRRALRVMEENGVGVLPVVDGEGAFLGVVERSRLVASLILDVSERVD